VLRLVAVVGCRVITPQLAHVVPERFTTELMNKMYGPARYEYDCDVSRNETQQYPFTTQVFFFFFGQRHVKAISQAISVPVWEILNRGGKRWRPVLLLLTAEALGKKADDVVDFVSLCEIVHNGKKSKIKRKKKKKKKKKVFQNEI
jgi:geranylgeranyl diphosphate synthase type I